ncbi:MAG: hypothetical protein JST10_06030 [Bacteroidetes bacterium]|nr:hypothetical protein [Bacteroidota bacterium]
MALNQILLTPAIITEFYSNCLIETASVNEHPERKTKNEIIWNFTGTNKNKILVLTNYPDRKVFSHQQQSFLKRMFEACKINFSDIALMNISQNPEADYNKLYKFFESRVIILFDIEPSSLGIPLSFPQFQVQPFGNCLFLFTPSIEKLEEDSLQRSKLWICLKRIFNI